MTEFEQNRMLNSKIDSWTDPETGEQSGSIIDGTLIKTMGGMLSYGSRTCTVVAGGYGNGGGSGRGSGNRGDFYGPGKAHVGGTIIPTEKIIEQTHR